MLKLLQARLVALRVRHRVLRRLLGAFEAAQFPAVGATEATVIGLLLKLLQTCLVALCVLRRALRCLLGALELAELTPLDATDGYVGTAIARDAPERTTGLFAPGDDAIRSCRCSRSCSRRSARAGVQIGSASRCAVPARGGGAAMRGALRCCGQDDAAKAGTHRWRRMSDRGSTRGWSRSCDCAGRAMGLVRDRRRRRCRPAMGAGRAIGAMGAGRAIGAGRRRRRVQIAGLRLLPSCRAGPMPRLEAAAITVATTIVGRMMGT